MSGSKQVKQFPFGINHVFLNRFSTAKEQPKGSHLHFTLLPCAGELSGQYAILEQAVTLAPPLPVPSVKPRGTVAQPLKLAPRGHMMRAPADPPVAMPQQWRHVKAMPLTPKVKIAKALM
jgi:hypothetical protein